MPIQFSQSTPQGVTVNYNVVSNITYDSATNSSFVQLESYVDQAAFNNGASPFPGQGFTMAGNVQVSAAEEYIVALPEWAGATIIASE